MTNAEAFFVGVVAEMDRFGFLAPALDPERRMELARFLERRSRDSMRPRDTGFPDDDDPLAEGFDGEET